MTVSIRFRKRMPAAFMALALMVFLLVGCGSSKGFRLAVETGGNADQKNMGEAAEQQAFFVSDDTKALPEISSEECEQLGDGLLNKGNLYSAYVQYEKSLKLKPDNIRVEYKKGLTLLLGEKNDDAIRQFEMVLKKEPKFDLANEGMGRAYFQKKDFLLAERHFKKAIDQNHKLWMSYNFLGNIYDKKKEYEKAILEYTSAIAVKPDQGLLYNNLGVSCLLAGHNQAAIDAFGKAVEKNYRESRVFNNMAVAYANLGHYDDATDAFRKAGGEAHAYNNMGCIYLEKGNYTEAVRCFEKAIAIEPSFYAKASDNLKKAKTMAAKQ
jgi:Flp pilus assembly protein TadD